MILAAREAKKEQIVKKLSPGHARSQQVSSERNGSPETCRESHIVAAVLEK